MPLLTTFIDFLSRRPLKLSFRQRTSISATDASAAGADPEATAMVQTEQDPDMKLPDRTSLLIMLAGGQLHQVSQSSFQKSQYTGELEPPLLRERPLRVSVTMAAQDPQLSGSSGARGVNSKLIQPLQLAFFILLPSSNDYAKHLGGSSAFAGLVIGIPMAISLLLLYPMSRWDRGQYARPLHICNVTGVLGNLLYALGYRTNYLYTLLLGRVISGISLTFLMFLKRYVTDPRLVGVRRRTTISSWLVFGQGVGFSAGPFFGGLLYKIGFENQIWNGYTAPAWIVSVVWMVYLVVGLLWFVDVPPENIPLGGNRDIPLTALPPSLPTPEVAPLEIKSEVALPPSQILAVIYDNEEEEANRPLTWYQKGTIICMCWYGMTCFYILGAWESNIPVFTSSPSVSSFNYSPYAAGNFIALGGAATFPFLFGNVLYARRIQDRFILASGASVGMVGLLIMLGCFAADKINFASFWVCWFLVALGFNLASTCTLTLLSKQLPDSWNGVISLLIQVSNYIGRVVGAIWGGSGVQVGVKNYLGMQIAVTAVGITMHTFLWKHLKAKTG